MTFAWKAALSAVAIAGLMGACTKPAEKAAPAAEAASAGVALSAAGLKPEAGEASPEGRLLIGRGTDYVPIAGDPTALFTTLEGSMAQRRATAWQVVEKVLQPQKLTVGGKTYDVPLWHTWYEGMSANDEVGQRIQLFMAEFGACLSDPACKKTREEIAKEVLARKLDKNLVRSLTAANMTQRLRQFEVPAANPEAILGQGFTLFSPSFVEHVLAESQGIETCPQKIAWNKPPPSATQFSPCVSEFPRSAVMIKTSWQELTPTSPQVSAPDTSATGIVSAINGGSWNVTATAPADPSKIYSVETTDGKKFGLSSMHISTKDTREWLWISLWWSPTPNEDLGQDRPASIAKFNKGVWANYKMCVTSAFSEKDKTPWKAFEKSQPSLAAAIKASYEALATQDGATPGAPTTWCSNPNLESHAGNGRTNCIGCHQYSFTWNDPKNRQARFNDTYDAAQAATYPNFGRSRRRTNFPAEFAWSFGFEFRPAITAARTSQGFQWPQTGGH